MRVARRPEPPSPMIRAVDAGGAGVLGQGGRRWSASDVLAVVGPGGGETFCARDEGRRHDWVWGVPSRLERHMVSLLVVFYCVCALALTVYTTVEHELGPECRRPRGGRSTGWWAGWWAGRGA